MARMGETVEKEAVETYGTGLRSTFWCIPRRTDGGYDRLAGRWCYLFGWWPTNPGRMLGVRVTGDRTVPFTHILKLVVRGE